MNRNLFVALYILLLSLAASCSGAVTSNTANTSVNQQAANSPGASVKGLPADVVVANAQKVEVEAGKSAQAEVKLAIKDGYHINANPPSQYQIATQLTVEASQGLTIGEAKYPASITKKFEFSEQPLAVYEKEAMITVPLSATAQAAKGERSLPARLRFQACDEQVCYPKRDLQLSIPVNVK